MRVAPHASEAKLLNRNSILSTTFGQREIYSRSLKGLLCNADKTTILFYPVSVQVHGNIYNYCLVKYESNPYWHPKHMVSAYKTYVTPKANRTKHVVGTVRSEVSSKFLGDVCVAKSGSVQCKIRDPNNASKQLMESKQSQAARSFFDDHLRASCEFFIPFCAISSLFKPSKAKSPQKNSATKVSATKNSRVTAR